MKDYVARLQATDWYFWAAKYFLVGKKKIIYSVVPFIFPTFWFEALRGWPGEERTESRWGEFVQRENRKELESVDNSPPVHDTGLGPPQLTNQTVATTHTPTAHLSTGHPCQRCHVKARVTWHENKIASPPDLRSPPTV